MPAAGGGTVTADFLTVTVPILDIALDTGANVTDGDPGNGCPTGSTVCDQFVTGGWPDVVFLAVLMVCAAAVLIAYIRRPK